MTNIELKSRYENIDKARLIAEKLGAIFQWEDEQEDTYYNGVKGRLKLRQAKLTDAELIAYHRSEDGHKPRQSDYLLYRTSNDDVLKNVLNFALPQKVIVKKQRSLMTWHNVRIHLDVVENLGNFIELEAIVDKMTSIEQAQEKINYLKKVFDLDSDNLISCSYADLLMQKDKAKGNDRLT